MAYQRIKRITEEERQARAQLKRMGVSEYELERLYDANYKARKRAAEIAGADFGKTLNLNWKNILQGARQAKAAGGSVSSYIKLKTQSYKGKYVASEIKKETIETITGSGTDMGDWGAELVQKTLKRYSAAEIQRLREQALEDMEDAGEEIPEPSSEAYKRAKRRYKETNASSQFEWDSLLRSEMAAEYENTETLLNYIARLIGVDIDGIRARQADVEALGGDSEFIEREKRKAFKEFGPA